MPVNMLLPGTQRKRKRDHPESTMRSDGRNRTDGSGLGTGPETCLRVEIPGKFLQAACAALGVKGNDGNDDYTDSRRLVTSLL